MSERIKNYLGVTGIILVLVIAWGVISFASSYSSSIQPSAYRSFSVTAEGKVTTIPDIAQISFGVTTEGGKDVGKLQSDNTKKMNDIIALLKQNGIDKKDLQTTNYSIQPRTQYYDCSRTFSSATKVCPPSEVVGYTISQNVSVKMRDFSKIGAVLSGVAKLGATNVSGLTFTIDDPDTAKAEARAEAVYKAKAKARMMAKSGGFSVGKLLSISEDYGGYRGYEMMSYAPMMKADSSGLPTPTIEAGSEDVTVNVTLQYEIK